MSTMKKYGMPLFVAFLGVAIGGCGGGNALDPDIAVQKRQLSEIYDCYTHYVKNNDKGPPDFAALKKASSANVLGLRAVEDGKYVLIWGVKDQDSGALLAYEKEAPTQGGVVLMANGVVKKMSADQIKAAKK